ncbi:hypothetical protein UCREL1_618 [Eutypa lata UCREL1]|uniref:Uncharacterized protein n=1 Tax=Eutypa lata (strain UCR-EL1) TaxID=1287681 RepID=M7T602_EUTLA|nr:hypothetical protein UCREL1_618 [Eutypa lata UCREL1]
MSRENQLGAHWEMNEKMERLLVSSNKASDAEWVSSVLVEKKPNPLSEQDYIGAPDQIAVLRATVALSIHLPEVDLSHLHGIVSDCFIHSAFWGFYHANFKESPRLTTEDVMRASKLFEENLAHLTVIFGLLGLFIRLLETGVITPSFGRFLKNYRAHHEHFERFHKELFSSRSDFNVAHLVEELEQHDPEGHVAFFEGFFNILGRNDWNFEGAYKRYGFVAQSVVIPLENEDYSAGNEDADML